MSVDVQLRTSMGGAARDFQRALTGAATFGLSEVGGKVGSAANKIGGAVTSPVSSLARTGAGARTMIDAPNDARRASAAAVAEQNRLAAEAEAKMKLQPKRVASDDFLANKNKALMNMRLGLMSSVGVAAGAASPSLSAPSLTGKSKLGS